MQISAEECSRQRQQPGRCPSGAFQRAAGASSPQARAVGVTGVVVRD